MLTGLGQARTWTSADGSKTFEGDLVSCDDNSVTVRRGIKQMTFKLALLSEEDQKWAKEEGAKIAAAEEKLKVLVHGWRLWEGSQKVTKTRWRSLCRLRTRGCS